MNTVMVVPAAMNDKTRCIILKSMDYHDYDAILTVYSKEYGKISFLAKGIRRMKSKNAGSLLPYTETEIQFDYHPAKTMFTLKTASSLHIWRGMHEDLEASTAASVIAEAVDGLLYQEVKDESIYNQLFQAMDLLDKKEDPVTVISLFLIALMKNSGIVPDVDECVICSRKQVSTISTEDGGFLCQKHMNEKGLSSMPASDLKRFRLLVKGGLEHFDLIRETGGAEMKDLRILVEMIRLHAGITMKSFGLFERLFSH